MGADAERARRVLVERRLPPDGDPAALRRGLTVQREDAVRTRRWLPAVLVLPAGGLPWLAVVDGAVELWVATTAVVATGLAWWLLMGRRIRLVDAVLEELAAGSSAVPPDPPR